MKKNWLSVIGLVIGLYVMAGTSFAVTALELKDMLDSRDDVTVIDIRSRVLYTQGHIPGALSIPSSIIDKKRLPPVGTVVVYGDGIRTDLTLEAVDTLNARTGIHAEMLEGGFSAWEAVNLPTTHKSGFERERLRFLSYQELEKAVRKNPDIVLVDLRSIPEKADTAFSETPAGRSKQVTKVTVPTLTDLSEAFPGLDIIRLTRMLRPAGKKWDIGTGILSGRRGIHHHNLYVLIDNGDGEAEKVARRLRAAGLKRIAILTGGEQILRRGGQAGLKTEESGR